MKQQVKNLFFLGREKNAHSTLTTHSEASSTSDSLSFYSQRLFEKVVTSLSPSSQKRIAILGKNETALRLEHFFQQQKTNGQSVQSILAYHTEISSPSLEADIEAFKALCLGEGINEIYCTLPENTAFTQHLAKFADHNFIYFRVAGHSPNEEKPTAYYYDTVPIIPLRTEPLASQANQMLKRSFDVAFSLLALIFLVPFVFPLIAIAIRLESKGDVFFVQQRPGKHNRLFPCLKFRSMRSNNESEKQASKNDMRITKVGAFLRKTSLDELPQFINVLLGHMSVVGPRPNMVKQLEYYEQVLDEYSVRHFITPGITGLAQVKGFRGETQSDELMQKRVALDLTYMQQWSFWLDLKIILLTVWNIFKGEEMAY